MSALDRLKNIQSNFKRTWNGIDCNISGRAGKDKVIDTVSRYFKLCKSKEDIHSARVLPRRGRKAEVAVQDFR